MSGLGLSQKLGAGYNRLVAPGRDLQWLAEPGFRLARQAHRSRWMQRPLGQDRSSPGRLIDATRVLVIRPDRIGDVVLSSAFLRELRRSLPPDASVTLLTRPEVYPLVQYCPYVDEVLTYAWQPGWNRSRRRRYRQAWSLARQRLWSQRFELAILPRWDVDQDNATVIAYLSGACMRAGFVQDISLAKAGGATFERLLTHPFLQPMIRHEVEHSLEMVRFLGGRVEDTGLELWLSEADHTFASRFLTGHHHDHARPLVALAAATGEAKRDWPLERYAALAVWLQQAWGARVLLIGGPKDRDRANVIQQALSGQGIIAAGEANLRQTAALLKLCTLYVGGDTGPMHMAAAAGARVVEISCHPASGSTSSPNAPERFRPWGEGHIVLQPATALSPCDLQCESRDSHCITQIEVERVQEAIGAVGAIAVGAIAEGWEPRNR